mmetsp:Transcript_125573/g.390935  ORF Transcript_125573/g.390935 Transcript_125573/m.390935 type:complete len:390 (+) Transcript_125573:1853-3022(+)
MEEAQHVHQRPERPVVTRIKVRIRNLCIRLLDVQLQALRGLGHNLQASLKDSHGECICGHCGEPKTEVLVRLVHVLQDLLQGTEPRGQQVAILEHHPVSTLVACLDALLGHAAHALAEGHKLELGAREAEHVAQLGHVALRIGPWGEDEDDGHLLVRLLKDLVVHERRWLHVVVTELIGYEALCGGDHPVRPEATYDQDLLEESNLVFVVARHVHRLGRLRLVPLVPLVAVAFDIVANPFDVVAQRLQQLQVLPAALRDPREGARILDLLQGRVALHVEVKLARVEVVVAVQDHGRHLEAEEKLVHLKDAHTSVVVHRLRHLLADILQPVVHDLVRLGLLQGRAEDAKVAPKGILVHLADAHQARHREIQDGAAHCHLPVQVPRLVNLL